MAELNLPDFDSMPKVKDMPQGCAWGLFDKDGKKDRLGCLNFLTPSVIKAAVAEVSEGHSISMNWPIGAIKTPGFGRKGLDHKVLSFYDSPLKLHGYDDEISFNTQCSSQWDSLCHFAHQPTGLSYNGVRPTIETLTQDFGDFDHEKALPTLNHWHDRGGVVGRGVLLDYVEYAKSQGIQYSAYDNHKITVDALEAMAKQQGVTFKQGDILIIRSGYTEGLSGQSAEEQDKMMGTHSGVGVEGCEAAAKWMWNKHFAAVAGDALAFENLPPRRGGIETIGEEGKGTINELVLHQYFLSLFGLNIGELWDLKALGEYCAKTKRYTFLLTSVPLNVPGGVGSPPNALAIF